MLPSLLAREIQNGLKHFLTTGFEPSDTLFSGVMQRFTEDESRWMKGPYIQLGLPFRHGTQGKTFFGNFMTEHPGHIHQEAAWKRLSSNRTAASTLVATGTGSGKTECFLYPLLDHCARTKSAGVGGIQALVIYPMNALAADQARRFAQVIAETPAFRGLRVGLFVGGRSGKDGRGLMTMTASSVITDRETLRKDPPDILLTNYKMLDYLLIRPKDRLLWAKNTAETTTISVPQRTRVSRPAGAVRREWKNRPPLMFPAGVAYKQHYQWRFGQHPANARGASETAPGFAATSQPIP
jgi:DEAD/DEAH box helicase domain-containing protein